MVYSPGLRAAEAEMVTGGKRREPIPALVRTYSIAGHPVTVWSLGGSEFARDAGGKLHGALARIFDVQEKKPRERVSNYVVAPASIRHRIRKLFLGGRERSFAHAQKASEMGADEEPKPLTSVEVILKPYEVHTRTRAPFVSDIFKDLLKIAGEKGKLLTWGVSGAVRTGKGLAGVLVLGPQGAGKTELVAKNLVEGGGFHHSDDVVRLGFRKGIPRLEKTGYNALFRYRGVFKAPRKALQKAFVETARSGNAETWRHLPLGDVRKLFFPQRRSSIHVGESVPLDTILFVVPFREYETEQFDNLHVRGGLDSGKAVKVLESGQWNRISGKERESKLSEIFEVRGTIDPHRKETLVNWNDPESLRNAGIGETEAGRVRGFVAEWIRKQAMDEYGVPRASLSKVGDIVRTARALHLVGKWTPPHEATNFANMLAKDIRESHHPQRELWLPTSRGPRKLR